MGYPPRTVRAREQDLRYLTPTFEHGRIGFVELRCLSQGARARGLANGPVRWFMARYCPPPTRTTSTTSLVSLARSVCIRPRPFLQTEDVPSRRRVPAGTCGHPLQSSVEIDVTHRIEQLICTAVGMRENRFETGVSRTFASRSHMARTRFHARMCPRLWLPAGTVPELHHAPSDKWFLVDVVPSAMVEGPPSQGLPGDSCGRYVPDAGAVVT